MKFGPRINEYIKTIQVGWTRSGTISHEPMPTTLIRVSINFAANEWLQARDFLTAVGRPDLARAPRNRFGYTLNLASEEELAAFMAVAEAFNFASNVGVGRTNTYSPGELASAALLSVRYTRRARGIGGPESGTQYDFEAGCACCATGSRQTSELFIKGKLPEHRGLVQTETGEWLLSQEIVHLLGDRLTGVKLVTVRATRSGALLPWVQLLAEFTLPRFEPTTTGVRIERQCPCCLRNGYFGKVSEPFSLHYASSVCACKNDVMQTWEHFGLSSIRVPRSDSVLATPELIISSRLFAALRAQKVRGVAFTPVVCDGAMTPGETQTKTR
jgi:hypothetical protein